MNESLLIVDDEADLRDALAEFLGPMIGKIQVARDGIEALALIHSGEIGVVLSDINMPKMSGLELLAKMRFLGLETPFIFLSAHVDMNKAVEALRLGATDFLEKPFDPDVVLDVVSKAMELSRALKEVEAETEKLYAAANIPVDQRIRLRKMRQSVVKLRKAAKIYIQ